MQWIFPGDIESEQFNVPASSTCENITSEQQKTPKFRRGLKVGYLNVNQLYNKLDELKATLPNLQFDVFGVSETWLTSEISENEIKIPGYTAFRRDRKTPNQKQGGGLVVYIRNELNAKERTEE